MGLVNGGAVVLQATPATINFGNVITGNTATQTIFLRNLSGNVGIDIDMGGITCNLPSISIGTYVNNMLPMTNQKVTITWVAPAIGNYTGTITILSDADSNPVTVAVIGSSISGSGTVKQISVNPSTWIFLPTQAGQQSAVQPFVITNTGNADVTIQIPVLLSPFQGSGLPVAPTVVHAGGTLTFGVFFAPLVGGYVASPTALVITSDAATSPTNVDLEGQGVIITPAYVVNGGTEEGYVAFGPVLWQFQATNFVCESPAFAQKTLQLQQMGMQSTLQRVEVQFQDKGLSNMHVEATVKRYNSTTQQQFSQTIDQFVPIGSVTADDSILNTVADLGIQGEIITLKFTPGGAVFLVAYAPEIVPASEVKKE